MQQIPMDAYAVHGPQTLQAHGRQSFVVLENAQDFLVGYAVVRYDFPSVFLSVCFAYPNSVLDSHFRIADVELLLRRRSLKMYARAEFLVVFGWLDEKRRTSEILHLVQVIGALHYICRNDQLGPGSVFDFVFERFHDFLADRFSEIVEVYSASVFSISANAEHQRMGIVDWISVLRIGEIVVFVQAAYRDVLRFDEFAVHARYLETSFDIEM